jgi:hypothetical protein
LFPVPPLTIAVVVPLPEIKDVAGFTFINVTVCAPVGPEAVTLAESITLPVPSISYNGKAKAETADENVNVNIND